SWRGFHQALMQTMMTSSMVLFLAVTSNIFGAVFSRLGTAGWVSDAILALPIPPELTLGLIVFLIFLLGWPFEWPAIILVFLPIFYPILVALKVDLVWFGAVTAVTLQTAFLSPPVAMSAYYIKQVVKEWSLKTIYAGMMEFMVIQAFCIVILFAFPQIATYLPSVLFDKPLPAALETEPASGTSESGKEELRVGEGDELEKGDVNATTKGPSPKTNANNMMKGDDLEKSDDLK
ncbi:MAG: TRAP transporter large permease subunit, partial [Betaproteobacteria bacterium]|nr:TRAP transporter large permease subunit [Betaproteobacteria bacterium]